MEGGSGGGRGDVQAMPDGRDPIVVHHVGHGRCLVWDPQGVEALRGRCRLVGCLVGSFPHHKQQNAFCSMPLLLLPEEVSLALRHGWIKLIDDSVPYQAPCPDDIVRYQQCTNAARLERERRAAQQREREAEYWKQRRTSTTSAENERKSSQEHDTSAIGSSSYGSEQSERMEVEEREQRAGIHRRSPSNGGKEGESIPLAPADVAGQPWKREERVLDWEEWRRTVFPRADPQALRREAVFADLWRRTTSYITSGVKFGGDFLVYPGDPLMFHAAYIVIVVGWSDVLSPLDLVSIGRIAVGVKKSTVFASVMPPESNASDKTPSPSPEQDKVTYITIDWRGVT